MKKVNILLLPDMIGATWMYRAVNYKFLSYQEADGVTTLVTDRKWFTFESKTKLEYFLAECLPTEEEVALQAATADNNIMAELKGVLIENIKKIGTDASYVPQAKAISSQISTLVSLKKLEMDMLRMNKGN